jgi:hypothetical protein
MVACCGSRFTARVMCFPTLLEAKTKTHTRKEKKGNKRDIEKKNKRMEY